MARSNARDNLFRPRDEDRGGDAVRLVIVTADRAEANGLAASLAKFDVEMAIDVQAALSVCRHTRPDLIIGKGDEGRALCRALHADESLRDIPVLLLTPRADVTELLAAFDAGADAYLATPYRRERLLASVRRATRAARSESPSVQSKILEVALHASRERLMELLVWAVNEVAEQQHELEEKQSLVDSLRRHRQDFTALVAHELRNPLQSLLLRAQLAAQGDARSSATLPQTVEDKVTRVVLLLGDVLDLERLDAGALTLERKWVDLPQLVRDATTRVAGPRAIVSVRDSVAVDADPDRVEQVLRNYLSHALAREPSGSRVYVGVERRNGVARVSVTDHGPRMDSRAGLFDRHPPGQAPKGGSLYLCRALAELQDGRVGVDVAPEPASNTIWIELPVAGS
jgi:signal transduction histidine kinase